MKKRLTGALTLGLIACTAIGLPAAADAHSNHPCFSNAPSGYDIFECKSEVTLPPGRYISSYYNGTERGHVSAYRNSSGKLIIQVCDMYTDNFRPKLEILTSGGSVIGFSDWNSAGCSKYERSYSVTRIRIAHYKLSGEFSHNSAWQRFGF